MNVQKKVVKMCLGCAILENGAEMVISVVEKDTAVGIACRNGGGIWSKPKRVVECGNGVGAMRWKSVRNGPESLR